VSGAPEESLSAASTSQNTGGWDSYANLTLMASIEEEFGVRFETSDMMQLKSLGDLASWLEARRPAGQGG
jgi:acyl carrier protein